MQRINMARVVACFLFVATVASGIMWCWSTFWLQASVIEMTEQLERDGVIDSRKAAAARQQHESTGSFVMQGWNARSLMWGMALLAAGVLGTGFAVIVLWKRPALGIGNKDRVV
jgi:hypothetical protein